MNEGKHITQDSPFNVTITEGGWAGNGRIIRDAIHHYYLVKAFPGLLEPDAVLMGCIISTGHIQIQISP